MAIDPSSGKQHSVQLDYDKLRHIARLGVGRVKEAGYLVPEVLARPAAVFRGLLREGDEPRRGAGWLCYVGQPRTAFDDTGRSVPAHPDRVFLVFVNDEGVAYNWYWCASDAHQPGLPEGYADRFREQLL